jgi:hypothetical protein
MVEKLKAPALLGFMVILLLSAGVLAVCPTAMAAANVKTIEGMKYNVGASLQDNLQSLVGKKVYVTMDSGKTFAGFVKQVGNHFVHLEKLDGKDFFDALIRIEDISVIDAKFRDFER